MIAKVFYVLKWTPTELDRTIATLLEENAVLEKVEDAEKPRLVSLRGLEPDL